MSSGMRHALFALGLFALACNGTPPANHPHPIGSSTPSSAPGGGAPVPGTPTAAASDAIPIPLIKPVETAMSVAGVTALCDDNLALAGQLLDSIRGHADADAASLTWEATLGQLDNAFLAIGNASEFPYLMGVAHPEEKVRVAARACEGKTDKLLTSIWLDPELAATIRGFATAHKASGSKLSPERERFLKHSLRDFRRNGMELSKEHQERLREINKEITELGQRFTAAISSSRGVIHVKPISLTGLSDAYIAEHPAGDDGKITISTDYPDYYPFVTYSRDRAAAKELYIKFTNRGGQDNVARLDRLLTLRHEKATMLGYASWADYAIEPRMAATSKEAMAFLARVSSSIKGAVKKEFTLYQAENVRLGARRTTKLIPADRYYLTDRLRERVFKFDSKKLARYFEVERVTKGLLEVTAAMYGITYQPVSGPTWHPAVKGYDVISGGKAIGRFYLDLEPRPDKYKHAAMFTLRTAKRLPDGTQQTPIASLVCNFPAPGQPMPHDQVVTYFHEFGHVLHHLLSDTELASFAGTNTVRDFVEAPSQMFEEWAWSREVLDRFAQHEESGAKLPDSLFEAMKKSRHFGLALSTERQIWLAMLDLTYHTTEPPFDTTRVLKRVSEEYFSFGHVKGTHFQSSFGHLIGYDAGYYGYQWALALAHDVLSRFKKEGLMNPKTAADWRNSVLSSGGSRDERGMIREFLGRDPSEKAYVDFLAEE